MLLLFYLIIQGMWLWWQDDNNFSKLSSEIVFFPIFFNSTNQSYISNRHLLQPLYVLLKETIGIFDISTALILTSSEGSNILHSFNIPIAWRSNSGTFKFCNSQIFLYVNLALCNIWILHYSNSAIFELCSISIHEYDFNGNTSSQVPFNKVTLGHFFRTIFDALQKDTRYFQVYFFYTRNIWLGSREKRIKRWSMSCFIALTVF